MEIFYNPGGTDKLQADTYGRGLWEIEILAPLPVEQTSFTVKNIKNKILLNWHAPNEVNNYGFEIKRASTPLSTINPSRAESREWKKIGFVEGHGNSNSPNPFNPTTTIHFDLAEESNVSLTIYNVIGEVVKKLVDQKMTAGKHKVSFDASQLSSGIYFYQLNTSNFADVKKMMVVK
ncbi:MAG: T9SS type A sorting domain-containing protein [Chlorobi bacterium]|nr:T9SS type A sorting domain-containing protein [Chlorobiota bacterium]